MDTLNTPQAAVSISAAELVVPQRSFYRHYVLALLTGIYAVILPAGWRRVSRSC